jgi:restriction system protein
MAKQTEATMWGIHGGRYGDADALFKRHKVVALGWTDMGDLSRLGKDREAFRAVVADVYNDAKPGAIPNYTGQLFRFVHEMQVGDLVVYPSQEDRQVHLGRVEGEYVYDPKTEPAYPHHRAVQWLKALPRTHFSQGALYEIGSAMSFFQVRNFADEFRAALEGQPPVPPPGPGGGGFVSDEIEQATRDFVLRQLSQEMKGHPFADFVAHLLNAMGYQTRVSPEGPDAGIDIIAHKDELGFEPPIIKVQVKSTEGSLGDPVVSALYGKVDQSEFGLLVTLGSITNPARNFARGKSNLRLIDGEDLVDLILEHYDGFDAKYKGLIPLKRVYVPAPLEEGQE